MNPSLSRKSNTNRDKHGEVETKEKPTERSKTFLQDYLQTGGKMEQLILILL